jgi:hypothetical protein
MLVDGDRLATVALAAFDACSGKKDADRWQRAIAKAQQQLESNPYIHLESDGLFILSDSLTIYKANGVCQCRAWERGKYPCWHRAAYRLARRYVETSH